jgi:hypothetical protein
MAEKGKGTRAVVLVGGATFLTVGLIYLATRKAGAAPPTPPPPGLANVYGVVTDSSTGKPISGVGFALNSFTTSSGSSGDYSFNSITPGDYVIALVKDGYESLTNSITVIEGQNKLNIVMIPTGAPPPGACVEITSISLDKTEILAGELFTISITFSNPTDYDVYVRPKFAFGKTSGTVFTAEKVLAQWDYVDGGYLPKQATDWVNLGHPKYPGSNMPQFVYDGDGYAVIPPGDGAEQCWLKVPAHGQATTSREWCITIKDFEYGVRDICVKVDNPFYIVYDPGWGTRTVGGVTYVLNWRPIGLDALSAIVPDIATIGFPWEAITVDNMEVMVNFSTHEVYTRVAITNSSGITLTPPESKILMLYVNGNFWAPYDVTFGGEQIYSLGPGTTVREYVYKIHSSLYDVITEGAKCLIWVHLGSPTYVMAQSQYYALADKGFKGKYSSQWQTPIETPVVIKLYEIPYTGGYMAYATFPEG